MDNENKLIGCEICIFYSGYPEPDYSLKVNQ